MKKSPRVLVRAVLVVAILLVAFPVAAGVPKVTICHFPPGNPGNAQTITIGLPAVAPHMLLHGDTIGPCEEPPPPPEG
ncbi:MAG: hypothetical protein OES32_09905 [Acidobacteriota bacterium]|nr:hypothetical protein [Acidobacteriota bacterium]MDH3523888.1 hypothetical protein [Acidobacteriota bacterium]